MSQSINKIHSKNLIQPSNDEDLYIYNGQNKWVKTNSKIYKVYNKTINDLNVSDYKDGDNIVLHNTFTNHIKYSEYFNMERKCGLNPSKDQKFYWNKNNVFLSESNKTFFSILNNYIGLLDSQNELNSSGNVEHSMSQIFTNKPGKTYVFSCFIKANDLYAQNISLSISSDDFKVGVYSKFSLNNMKTPSIVLLNDNYAETSHMNTFIDNTSANFEKIIIDDDTYYRLYISACFNFNSQCRCKINILNDNNDFLFPVTSLTKKYGIYASGFQLEINDDKDKPSPYVPTFSEVVVTHPISSIYQVYKSNFVEKNASKICYFDSVNEIYDEETGQITLESYKPTYYDISYGDIGIVSSILSFSNTDIEKNKKIVQRRNENSYPYDDISKNKVIEMCSDSALKLGSLEDSKEYNKFPIFTIFYDKKSKEYKFITDTGLKTLNYNSTKKTYHGITNALIHNQGYFETWHDKGKCVYKHGFNTGGNYNFWKLNKLK